MDDKFQLESDILGKKGKSDDSNNGNVEKPVGKSASNELDDRESDETKDVAVIGNKGDKEDKKWTKKWWYRRWKNIKSKRTINRTNK